MEYSVAEISESKTFMIEKGGVTFRENSFTFNFASERSAITFIHGFKSVFIQNEVYESNGDFFTEAFQIFSPILIQEEQILLIEDFLANLISNVEEALEQFSIKSDSVIEIIGGSYIEIKDSEFNRNWHKEFPIDLVGPSTNTSQIVSLVFCNGEFVFTNNIVHEHKGMYKNEMLAETFPEIVFLEADGKRS